MQMGSGGDLRLGGGLRTRQGQCLRWALLLTYSPEGCVISDVVEPPASGGADGNGMGFIAKLHGIEGPVVVRPEAGEPVRRRLCEGLCVNNVDDMEAVLGKDGKGKTPLKWAGVLDRDDDIDIRDDKDMEDVTPRLMSRPRGGRACGGECLGRINELGRTLGRVEGMVKMLVELGGLAGPEEGSARVRYSTALPHLLLFIIFLISHVYYICYFLLSMYGHQGNAGTLSHVISVNYRKR